MWLVIALCAGSVIGDFIQTKEKAFEGEDTRLAVVLQKRMSCHLPASMPTGHTPDIFLFALKSRELQLRQNARRDWRFPNKPEDYELKMRTIDLMRQHIYATQYRLRDLQLIITKYSRDINFRVAYIYCRLDTLLNDMLIMLARINRTVEDYYKQRPAFEHLIYYNYFLKKNTDVTYIVEHMIVLHTKYISVRFPVTARPAEETTITIRSQGGRRPPGPGGPGQGPGGPGPGPGGPGQGPGSEDSPENGPGPGPGPGPPGPGPGPPGPEPKPAGPAPADKPDGAPPTT